MEKFKKQYERHQKLMNTKAMSDVGAGDTEPGVHFETEVIRWIDGKDFRKLDANGWELYSITGSKAAAKKLTGSLRKVYDEYAALSITVLPDLKAYLKTKFWYKDITRGREHDITNQQKTSSSTIQEG